MLDITKITDILKRIEDESTYHVFYKKSVKVKKDITDTFSYEYPEFLNIIRPKESSKDKAYRKTVFKNPITAHRSRILDKLIKIKQSEDFTINYPETSNGSNELRDYTDRNFNGYDSLVNWIFSNFINVYGDDANAVLAVFSKEIPSKETQPYKPIPVIFNSENVLIFEKGKYCVLREIDSKNETLKTYYIFDEVNYWTITNFNSQINIIGPTQHFCGEMPCFKIGKYIQEENSDGSQLYKSLLTDTLTFFQSAVSRFSDIEIELVHHVHTKEWQIAPKDCGTCKGKGMLNSINGDIPCQKCNGHGKVNWSALDILQIDFTGDKYPGGDGKQTFPFNEPGGYVKRNIEALRELKLSFQQSIDDAYGAIDFDILRKKETTSAESGLSKQYNRLEYTQKIYSEGRHIIENVLLRVYKFIDAQLFGINSNSKVNRIPDITIPISFDVMSPETILQEIKIAKDAGVSQEIIGALNLKYVKLVFGSNSKEYISLKDEINLNPHYGKTVDEILALYGGGEGSPINGVSEIDFIIYSNFKSFIDKGMREIANWDLMTETDKFKQFEKYATEKLKNKPKQLQLVA